MVPLPEQVGAEQEVVEGALARCFFEVGLEEAHLGPLFCRHPPGWESGGFEECAECEGCAEYEVAVLLFLRYWGPVASQSGEIRHTDWRWDFHSSFPVFWAGTVSWAGQTDTDVFLE